ncbi:histidinol-phosphate transaminase [Shumkonia mesophila]|uniref:histidinol-phosphate transaminase n=1 Tax=Shumkonia mesophila TaxID=2838854 RepID=UPI002934F587|nr:histidinol-phosphate transaminase [Shumkonia mesophila]
MSLLVPQPGIMDITPYVGGESKIQGVSRIIKLASNEGAFGPSPKAVAAFVAHAGEMHRYPDGGCTALREAVAARHGLDASRIVFGAGSDELIGLLCRAYAGQGDEVLYSEHGFLMYPIAARSASATPVAAPDQGLTADVDAILAKVTKRTRIVFLANPNNPTGTYLPRSELARLRAGLSDNILLVIDAAYSEYIDLPDFSSGLELVDGVANTVMTRTFSKIYGMGGLRLGWAYCPAAVADVLNRVRNPFNVGSAAQAAGLAAFADTEFVAKVKKHNDEWLPWTIEQVRALGFEAPPSVGNFMLVRFPAGPGRDVPAADAFLKARGLIVRRVAGYGLPDALRVTIGREDEMRAFIGALGEFARQAT